MEDALRVRQPCRRRETTEVLILVLMEDALRGLGWVEPGQEAKES